MRRKQQINNKRVTKRKRKDKPATTRSSINRGKQTTYMIELIDE